MPSEKLYGKPVNLPNGMVIHLKDVDRCIDVLDCYFPNFSTQITPLPELEKIPGGVFYGHVDEEGNPINEPLENRFKESGYKGEVFDFYCSCIGNLKEAHGLLINEFDQVNKRKVVFSPRKENNCFEIDWLYCNNDKLVVIEAARKLPSNDIRPEAAVEKKIKQMVEKSMPVTKSIINTILNSMGKGDEEKVNIPSCKMQYLICVTNNTIEEVNSSLQDNATLNKLESNGEIEDFIKNLYFLTKETVDFMTSGVIDKAYLYQLSSSGHTGYTVSPSLKLKDFFTNSETNEEISREMKYITSILSIAKMLDERECSPTLKFVDEQIKFCLKEHFENCPIKSRQVEEHAYCYDFYISFGVQFDHTQREDAERKHAAVCNEKNHKYCPHRKTLLRKRTILLLSPQQLHILKRDPKRLYIYGEAGSGKTNMLLAKLLLCCGLDYWEGKCSQMKRVLFLLPRSKVYFFRYIKEFISKHCHEGFVDVCFTEDLPNYLLFPEVILCDELYSESHWNYFGLATIHQIFKQLT